MEKKKVASVTWIDVFFLEEDEQITSSGLQSSPALCVVKLVTPACSFCVSRGFTLSENEVG